GNKASTIVYDTAFPSSIILLPIQPHFGALGGGDAFEVEAGGKLDFNADAAGVPVHALLQADIDVVHDILAHLKGRDGILLRGAIVLSRRLQQADIAVRLLLRPALHT